MKKNIVKSLLWIATLAAASSCSQDAELNEPARTPAAADNLRVVVSSDGHDSTDDSRAEFFAGGDGITHVRYTTGDEMLLWEVGAVSYYEYNYVKTHTATSATLADNAWTAEFNYSVPVPMKVGDTYPGTNYKYDKVYYTGILPRTAFVCFIEGQTPSTAGGSGNAIFLNLPRVQTPSAESPDPSAILLCAYDAQPENGVVTTRFKHMTAYMKIAVKGLKPGEKVSQINISATGSGLANDYAYASSKEAQVYCRYDLSQAAKEYYNGNGFFQVPGHSLIIETSGLEPDAKGNYTVWVGCAPNLLDGSLGITVKTDLNPTGNGYYKSVPLTRQGGNGSIALKAGRVAAFSLNFGQSSELSEPNPVVKENLYQTEGEQAGKTKLLISWSKPLNTESYVYAFDDEAEQETSAQEAIFYVEPGSQHTFRVKATASGYTDSGFAELTVTAIRGLAAPVPAIDPASVTTSSFRVAWEAVEGASAYRYTLNDGATAETTATSVRFDNLTDGTAYTVAVQAVSDNPEFSAESAWGHAYTTTLTDERTALVMGPVTANPSATAVKLSWERVSGATGYLYKIGENGTATETATTECTVTNLTSSTTYTAYVKAVDASGTCKDSEWVETTFTTPAPNQPTLSWSGDDLNVGFGADSEKGGLHYQYNTSGSQASFDSSKKIIKLGGAGSETGRNIWFEADRGPGTLRIKAASSGSDTRTLIVSVDGTVLQETIPAPGSAATGQVHCASATAGSIIKCYSSKSGINIYSIEWIPD